MNQSRSGLLNTLVGVILSLILLVLTAGLSFFAGTVYGRSTPETIEVEREVEVVVEKEVTVEVPVENIVEVEVTRLVEQPTSGGAVAESVESEEIADSSNQDAAQEESSPTPQPTELPEIPTPLPTATVVAGPPVQDLDADDLDLFFEAWELLEEEFYGTIPTEEQLNYALINAAIETLDDQFTSFAEPRVAEQLRESMSGTYEGIGAFVNERDDGFIEITRPIQGLPADRAGLKSGDLIIEVDGVNIVGMTVNEVITLVRGPRDSAVVLGVARDGEEELLQITVVRARIEIPTVEYRMLEGDIGYISLTSFNGVATEQMVNAYNELSAQNPKGMILDVRNNPGGFLNVAIEIADLFLPDATILLQRDNEGLENVYESADGDAAEDVPLVLLINESSASASELIAGAFQDNERATLVGVTSFGKGSVQHVHTLSDGSELRVTFSRFYTPDDKVINGVGITPDIIVEFPEDAIYGTESDTQLQEAIDFIEDNY